MAPAAGTYPSVKRTGEVERLATFYATFVLPEAIRSAPRGRAANARDRRQNPRLHAVSLSFGVAAPVFRVLFQGLTACI